MTRKKIIHEHGLLLFLVRKSDRPPTGLVCELFDDPTFLVKWWAQAGLHYTPIDQLNLKCQIYVSIKSTVNPYLSITIPPMLKKKFSIAGFHKLGPICEFFK